MRNEDTKRAVEGYFDAWTKNEVERAYAWLADDLAFWGPTAAYASREAFKPALIGFAAMTKGAKVLSLVIEDDRAALLYDCELPAPVGWLKIASFFRVENGKIRQYETLFDATELRKLLAAKKNG